MAPPLPAAAAAAKSTSSTKEVTVRIPLDEDETLGVKVDDRLAVINVQKGTPAFGKLRKDDVILQINDRRPRNVKEFFRIVAISKNQAVIVVRRRVSSTREKSSRRDDSSTSAERDNVPPDLPITHRQGYVYKTARIELDKSKRFGLSIKTRENRVMVVTVDEGSMCAVAELKPLDHILFIDRARVSQSEVAQPLLLKGLKERPFVECVIGRPTTSEAIYQAEQLLQHPDEHDPPSIRLSVDVAQVMRQQLVNSALFPVATQSILTRDAPRPPPTRRASFGDNHQVLLIQSDNSGRSLRPVNPGGGSPNSPITSRRRP